MAKNVIVSEDTIRDLLEAHASLAAWYYTLTAALRQAGGSVQAPDDAARIAFLERVANDYPEVAAVARGIKAPRMYVPPPPAAKGAPLESGQLEHSTLIEPAAARARKSHPDAAGSQPGASGPPGAPPPVDPTKVRY